MNMSLKRLGASVFLTIFFVGCYTQDTPTIREVDNDIKDDASSFSDTDTEIYQSDSTDESSDTFEARKDDVSETSNQSDDEDDTIRCCINGRLEFNVHPGECKARGGCWIDEDMDLTFAYELCQSTRNGRDSC